MSKLVDKERLARLAQKLDERMKNAVKAEADRAKAAEEGLQGKIDAINNADSGILAAAKKYADDQDAAQKTILDAEDKRLDQAIEDEAAAARAAEEALDGRVDTLEAFKNAHSHTQIETDIVALEQKDVEHEGRMDDIEDAADALDGRVEVNEGKLAVIQGNAQTAGSIAKAQADAQAYADQKIAALVDSAPDAMNTLNELAKAINDNKDIYDAYVEEHAAAMAQQKTDLQAEIDADVKVEKERAEGKEAELLQAINNEADRADGVEKALAGRIAANETFVKAQPAIDTEQDRRIGVLEGLINNEETGVQKQIDDLVDALDNHKEDATTKHNDQESKIGALQGRATAVEGRATELEAAVATINSKNTEQDGRLDALEEFEEGHSHTTMEQGIAANKAAIEVLNGDVETAGSVAKSIADALVPYSTTAEVKQILTNVVATLDLSIVDDQVVLKLGGPEGVALTTTTLDMATDADIDAIITGLDAE